MCLDGYEAYGGKRSSGLSGNQSSKRPCETLHCGYPVMPTVERASDARMVTSVTLAIFRFA